MGFIHLRSLAATFLTTFTFTLVLVSAVSASDPLLNVNRREHAALKRVVKMRMPDAFGLDPVQNIGGNPPAAVSSTSTSTATSSSSTTLSIFDPLQILGTSSGSSTSTTSSSSSTTSTSSSASSTSTLHSSSVSAAAITTSHPSTSTAIPDLLGVTITSQIEATPSTSATAPPSLKGSSSLSHGALTVLIVIGSSIGVGAILWTIFRKWKLRASSRFEDRLEPISWQPTANGDTGLPGQNRRASIASSFHSSGHDGLMRSNSTGTTNYGASGGYGATGQAPLNPIPDHDFTAGASHLAPVGGYADLSRGQNSQPQMQDLQRGTSINYGYDHGTRNHPQDSAAYGYANHY